MPVCLSWGHNRVMRRLTLLELAYVGAVSSLGLVADTRNNYGLYLAVLVALLPVGVIAPIALFMVASVLTLLFGDGSGPEWQSALLAAVAFGCAAVANVATIRAFTSSASRCRRRQQQAAP